MAKSKSKNKSKAKGKTKNFAVVKTKQGPVSWVHVNKDFKEKDYAKVLNYTEEVSEAIEGANKENAKLK